ncbi:MAG: GntR family transcriptional regulator [Acidimicrobiia bacterium]
MPADPEPISAGDRSDDEALGSPARGVFGVRGPAAEGVRQRILRDIAEGALQPGQRLGSERELAKHFGVSRSTLRAALEALELAGAVHRVVGRAGGTFVADRRVVRDLSSISVPRYLRRQGFTHSARVLSTTTLQADDEIAEALDVPAGATVFELVRVRYADETPISLERAVFPAQRFPRLLNHPLGGSILELLESEYGLVCGEAVEHIAVVTATSTAARLLGVGRAFPLVSIVRRTIDSDGSPWELSHDLFRSDRIAISVRAQPANAESEAVGVNVNAIGMDGSDTKDTRAARHAHAIRRRESKAATAAPDS